MHPVVRRTINSLSAAYALAWAGAAMVVGPGSATLVALTGNLSHAGFFVALFSLSSATGAAVFGRLMDRFGRKWILVAVHMISATGYTTAGLGAIQQIVPVFVLGGGMLAFGFGGILLTRVAAAEIFPPIQRGRGVGRVQVSATVGAVVGPVLLILSDPIGHFIGRDPLTLVWFFAPPLHLLAAVLLTSITEPLSIAHDIADYHPETRGQPPQVVQAPGRHVLLVVIVALAASQAAMVAIMGVAGAAVHHAGHAVWLLGVVMALHFIGMFGLSPLVGRVADRFGRRNTVLTGLAILAAGGALVAAVPGIGAFAAGLMLVGFGWSFSFIGATVLITDIVPTDRRARVTGRADLSAQLSAAALAVGGGAWFALHGVTGLGLVAVVVAVAAIPMLLFVRESEPGVFPRRAQVS